ncbi:DUF4291 domain-containing protein [Spongiactinospora rosea]|uniref:DUF4291 domain-containing protein n=1 Tax=Spongiactinospora rosea TaxID=2248750 RepID=A0A366M7H3_9ACTN|nr:DUF4291 domain-containing protein [Spongiactinospora rosea]RBQ22146.1 DUF4291 domain-containing protein [Spongiactinospora rosea]
MNILYRQIRAAFTDETITVYQAYDPAIAVPAVVAQRFVAPFKRERMTWIKPSFLWMMYRCGWGTKAGQTRVLGIDITREGFEWVLRHSCLSHPADGVDQAAWKERLRASPVRIQWDPERDPHHNPLAYRSIQVGLSGEAVTRYLDEWIVGINDLTDRVHEIHRALRDGQDVTEMVPRESPYPLPADLGRAIGATSPADSGRDPG